MIKIKSSGGAQMRSMAKKLAGILEDELDKLVDDVGDEYKSLVQANSPVDADGDDPGRMKRSWSGSKKKLGSRGRLFELENDCGYVPFVEYGHRIVVNGKVIGYQRGRFFVKKSRNKVTRGLKKRYDEMGVRVARRLGE